MGRAQPEPKTHRQCQTNNYNPGNVIGLTIPKIES